MKKKIQLKQSDLDKVYSHAQTKLMASSAYLLSVNKKYKLPTSIPAKGSAKVKQEIAVVNELIARSDLSPINCPYYLPALSAGRCKVTIPVVEMVEETLDDKRKVKIPTPKPKNIKLARSSDLVKFLRDLKKPTEFTKSILKAIADRNKLTGELPSGLVRSMVANDKTIGTTRIRASFSRGEDEKITRKTILSISHK